VTCAVRGIGGHIVGVAKPPAIPQNIRTVSGQNLKLLWARVGLPVKTAPAVEVRVAPSSVWASKDVRVPTSGNVQISLSLVSLKIEIEYSRPFVVSRTASATVGAANTAASSKNRKPRARASRRR